MNAKLSFFKSRINKPIDIYQNRVATTNLLLSEKNN